MKKLIAITILYMTAVSVSAQQYLTKEATFFKAGTSTMGIRCKLGCANNEYFILIRSSKKKSTIIQLNNQFIINTKSGDIRLNVSEEVLRSKDVEGFVKFVVKKSDVRKISNSDCYILLTKDDKKHIKLEEYFEGTFCKRAQSLLKETEKLGVTMEPEETKESAPDTKVYPSWRD